MIQLLWYYDFFLIDLFSFPWYSSINTYYLIIKNKKQTQTIPKYSNRGQGVPLSYLWEEGAVLLRVWLVHSSDGNDSQTRLSLKWFTHDHDLHIVKDSYVGCAPP